MHGRGLFFVAHAGVVQLCTHVKGVLPGQMYVGLHGFACMLITLPRIIKLQEGGLEV